MRLDATRHHLLRAAACSPAAVRWRNRRRRSRAGAHRARHGDLRRRLLLVRGGRLRQGRGRAQHHLRLYRRHASPNPTYQQVSAGGTGHTEAVEIVYDPAKVSYQKLLDVFWRNHDPLAKDRQFCDSGEHVPRRHLLSRRRAEAPGRGIQEDGRGEIRAAQPVVHRDHDGRARSIKAEDYHQDYYHEEPGALQILSLQLRPRSAARGALGQDRRSPVDDRPAHAACWAARQRSPASPA